MPTYEVLNREVRLLLAAIFLLKACLVKSFCPLQYLTQRGGAYLRLFQLMDELLVPGIEKCRAATRNLPDANKEQQDLRGKLLGQIDYTESRKWVFFALAALHCPSHKGHSIFQQVPFFQDAEAAR